MMMQSVLKWTLLTSILILSGRATAEGCVIGLVDSPDSAALEELLTAEAIHEATFPYATRWGQRMGAVVARLVPGDEDQRVALVRWMKPSLAASIDPNGSGEQFAFRILQRFAQERLLDQVDSKKRNRLLVALTEPRGPHEAELMDPSVRLEIKALVEAGRIDLTFPYNADTSRLLDLMNSRVPAGADARRAKVAALYGDDLARSVYVGGSNENFSRTMIHALTYLKRMNDVDDSGRLKVVKMLER